ncbi:MAG: hypothetical protein ABSA13_08080 [Beijerinckiaceae bacterium]|jgi:hypothetical protein
MIKRKIEKGNGLPLMFPELYEPDKACGVDYIEELVGFYFSDCSCTFASQRVPPDHADPLEREFDSLQDDDEE